MCPVIPLPDDRLIDEWKTNTKKKIKKKIENRRKGKKERLCIYIYIYIYVCVCVCVYIYIINYNDLNSRKLRHNPRQEKSEHIKQPTWWIHNYTDQIKAFNRNIIATTRYKVAIAQFSLIWMSPVVNYLDHRPP